MATPKGNIHLLSPHEVPSAAPNPPGRLHIFWPLPDPGLPVPDKWTVRRTLQVDGSLLQQSTVDEDLAALTTVNFFSQVRYLRVPSGPHVPIERSVTAARSSLSVTSLSGDEEGSPRWAAFREALAATDDHSDQTPDATSGEPHPDDAPADSTATVAHICVAVEDNADQDAVSQALNEGLTIIHATYRGLHASMRYESPLPSPESAPFGVLCALEVLVDGALTSRWGLGVFALNHHDLSATQPLAAADLLRLEAAVLHAATFDPTMLVFDLQRQAGTAANRAGDSRAAVVMAATACETFIDLVLGALLWQEGFSPDRAAQEMERYRDTKERMDRLLATRLKGRWDYKNVSALRNWREKVARGRNRVVHGGALPSSWSAQESIDAMYSFFSMVLDRLCDDKSRKTYNMAALLIAQRSGLESRGKWNAPMKATADRADELDMRGVFARWYNATTELRLPSEERRKINPARTYLAFAMASDGLCYWVERNEPAGLARLAEPQEDCSAWEALAQRSEHPKPGGITTFDTDPRYISIGPWLPEHHLIPGLAITLDPSAWYMPRSIDWKTLGPAM